MIEYVSIAKAVNQIENKDDIPYFIHSAFISTKGLKKEFNEFYDKVVDASKDLMNAQIAQLVEQELAP